MKTTLNEEILKMQKLAGIINEDQYQDKVNQNNEPSDDETSYYDDEEKEDLEINDNDTMDDVIRKLTRKLEKKLFGSNF